MVMCYAVDGKSYGTFHGMFFLHLLFHSVRSLSYYRFVGALLLEYTENAILNSMKARRRQKKIGTKKKLVHIIFSINYIENILSYYVHDLYMSILFMIKQKFN